MPWDRHTLPQSVTLDDVEYAILSDFRVALDIIAIMNDSEITDAERAYCCLSIFYPEYESMPHHAIDEAIEFLYWFIGGGEPQSKKKKKPMRLMDWEQDFPIMVSPINRVVGCDIRGVENLHWWTFLAAYNEIGDCLFAHIVSIRKKRAEGKKLDKSDEAFYRENQQLIELKTAYNDTESKLVEHWT